MKATHGHNVNDLVQRRINTMITIENPGSNYVSLTAAALKTFENYLTIPVHKLGAFCKRDNINRN